MERTIGAVRVREIDVYYHYENTHRRICDVIFDHTGEIVKETNGDMIQIEHTMLCHSSKSLSPPTICLFSDASLPAIYWPKY